MSTDNTEGRMSVYEIGYLLAATVPEEKIPAETDAIRAIITKAGATIIADEAPKREQLAYTIRTKNVSGTYTSHEEAYFGWFKFELATEAIEAVKKAVETLPSVVRMILITTVRENTYLGKRAPAAAAVAPVSIPAVKKSATDEKSAVPASVEEMDKSIEEMVKEV